VLIETAVGAFHVSGFGFPWVAYATLALLLVFAVVVLTDTGTAPCLCFGSTDRPGGNQKEAICRLALLVLCELVIVGHQRASGALTFSSMWKESPWP